MPCAAIRLSILLSGIAACSSAAATGPESFSLDPVHTRVLFAVSHAGFSQAMGTVSGSTGTLLFDPDDWRSARLDVRVPMQRLDLGDEKWNSAVLATSLLDGKRYPEAHFVSTRVEAADAGHAKVCGDLTLRGATRPLCMDVTLNAIKRHPLPPFHRTAGFSATAELSRADFGITAWKNVIGDEVTLRIEAEAVRGRSDDANRPASETVPATTEPSGLPPDQNDKNDSDNAEPTTEPETTP
jgi:polyisoprenoid-binding protein YceI